MTADDTLLLAYIQQLPGLIIPAQMTAPGLQEGLTAAEAAGYLECSPYRCALGCAAYYGLTEAGWIQVGALTNTTIVLADGRSIQPPERVQQG